MSISIRSLHTYPIKSCQGITLETAALTDTGIKYDRHWMLVNKQGEFLSQRSHPRMTLIKTTLTEDVLIAQSPDGELEIPLISDDSHRRQVKIWNDECSAARVSADCSNWFSDFLETDCDLVFLPDNETRIVDPEFSTPHQQVQFADGFPLLILSQASIDLLNKQLSEDIDINRFRANIILDGCSAHAEDEWKAFTVNNIKITLPKPCSRCAIPSIHQSTAEKNPNILKVLASYRRKGNHVYFGQNGIHSTQGVITCGQAVHPIK